MRDLLLPFLFLLTVQKPGNCGAFEVCNLVQFINQNLGVIRSLCVAFAYISHICVVSPTVQKIHFRPIRNCKMPLDVNLRVCALHLTGDVKSVFTLITLLGTQRSRSS